MLKEKARHYYLTVGRCCAESILMAANDVYDLQLVERDILLFTGFCGGMACGDACGCLDAAIGALSLKYAGREKEEFRAICRNFVAVFRDKLGADSVDCSVLEPKNKTEEERCWATVAIAADALEEYIKELDK